ncbi:LysM peptidoglycan-binding domain-containing protein [Nocardioides cheoyonin]|uniref:LysM peptidoglycan-binding domain-containing protein n=1 Tax=Nocardioides cheoyonin TaxID=3156615 RepID=UPI0032B4089B
MSTPNALSTRLRGLAATLALVAFMLGVPALLLAIDATPDAGAFSWSRLTSPDDGNLVLQVIVVVCWVAWAIFTCQLIASILSQIRGIRAPRVPGLAVPQLAADRLVAAALLFVAIPTATTLVPQPKAEAAVTATPLPAAPVPAAPTPPAPATHPAAPAKHEPATERYTVKRGDSLWKIAEQRLGDGSRYVEIVDLNEPVLGGRPDFLVPGTVLKVPAPGVANEGEYVVQPGDTLSEIAEDELGDADAYPSIFDASRGTAQADGAHLADPDLILPGWRLTIPGRAEPVAPPPPKHSAQPHDRRPALHPATDASTPPTTTDATSAPQTQADADHSDLSAWLLPGLAGTGAVFGAAFWIVLRAQRRTQLRWRRPGRIMPPPPPEVVRAEKTARVTATSLAPSVEELDAALQSLEPTNVRILTATLTGEDIGITLAAPADLAAPWTGSGAAWRLALADVPHGREAFPPYPLLVSVGQDDGGAFVFVNLEELRVVRVTGDSDRKAAFARHLAAELAVNPWSIVNHVDVLGLGADLASFHLGRVSTHPPGDTAFINALARHVGESVSGCDPDDFYAAIIATADRPDDELDALGSALEGFTGRTAAALIDLAGEPRQTGARLRLARDGRLTCSSLGLDVIAAGLSEDEARACALLLDLTLDSQDVPVPRTADPTATADQGGALVDELTEARPDEGPAGDASLLPLDAHVYADAAAATVEDIETLAPVAAPEAEAVVADADPGLDEDLARWESPTLTSTKLTLLGPVGARTTGDAKTTAARRPYYVELLAYLVLHPEGSTADDLAEAFGITRERARVSMSNLRRWLGTDPNTERPYLPDAKQTHTSGALAAYNVQGVLCDLDLFRRLRTRAQSKGSGGMDDLIRALRLVSGEPFSRLHDRDWSWLFEGERWDHIMTSAIIDVAHIVSAHALADDDTALALWAARTAYAAAPYDEVAQLDVIEAVAAGGDDEQAKKQLADRVFNRRDDDQPPIELPQRTAEIVEGRKWAPPRSRSHRTG